MPGQTPGSCISGEGLHARQSVSAYLDQPVEQRVAELEYQPKHAVGRVVGSLREGAGEGEGEGAGEGEGEGEGAGEGYF